MVPSNLILKNLSTDLCVIESLKFNYTLLISFCSSLSENCRVIYHGFGILNALIRFLEKFNFHQIVDCSISILTQKFEAYDSNGNIVDGDKTKEVCEIFFRGHCEDHYVLLKKMVYNLCMSENATCYVFFLICYHL